MRKAPLDRAYLESVDLIEVSLERAWLFSAHLSDVDLGGANLRQTELQNANLIDAKLTDADLRESNLGSADLRCANLSGSNLHGAWLAFADLRDAQVTIEHLTKVRSLQGALMPDGSDYDGRFGLDGDLENARALGVDTGDLKAMAHYYSQRASQRKRRS